MISFIANTMTSTFQRKKYLKWKTDLIRKPLLVFGSRQVGKTYSVVEFGQNHYQKIPCF